MHGERIERMRQEGLLTDAQARALHASLSSPLAADSAHRALPLAGIVTGLVAVGVLLLLALLFASGGGSNEIQEVSQILNEPGGTGAMNKPLSILTSAALLMLPLVLIIVAFAWFYNGIVNKEESVYEAWSQVESNLQRRADLIPNLVETVSRYMRHERETLDELTDKRARSLEPLSEAMQQLIAEHERAAESGAGVALDDEAALEELARAQQSLGGSLRNFVAVAENYPDLRSADQFLALQAQLEGTENRINVARMEFNRAVGDFNSAIRRLPGSLIAGMGNFRRKAYFQAEEGADTPAELNFDANEQARP